MNEILKDYGSAMYQQGMADLRVQFLQKLLDAADREELEAIVKYHPGAKFYGGRIETKELRDLFGLLLPPDFPSYGEEVQQ